MGRTYVHSIVHRIILDSYQALSSSHPQFKFMYAETGWLNGGPFYPHKTHQNGLSVDFMVPVKNTQGVSTYLPTNINNKFGYDIHFDDQGKSDGYEIDPKAMVAHLTALDVAAKAQGYAIKKVIFDPVLQNLLLNSEEVQTLKKRVSFSRNRVWVRHDEHYHVDFDVPCLSMSDWGAREIN